jgi:ribonuclease HI
LYSKVFLYKFFSINLLCWLIRKLGVFNQRILLVLRFLYSSFIYSIFNLTFDSRNVKIWSSKWIPKPSSFSIQSPCTNLDRDEKVYALIDQHSREWKTQEIQAIFEKEEAEIICNIPLSKNDQPDKLVWRATPSGNYTVKSAYYLEKERIRRESGECSGGKGWETFWKMIWGLKVPNSTKVFLWRACNNLLPTRVNLRRRGMKLEESCVICGHEPESILHVLWECPSAQDVWGVCDRSIQKMSIEGADFREIIETIERRGSNDVVGFFAVISRELWRRRNSVLHGGSFSPPNVLVCEAKETFEQFSEANDIQRSLTENQTYFGATVEKWRRPPPGSYKINWDVGIDEKKNRLGVGIIIRDAEGKVTAARSLTVQSKPTPVVGEAIGAFYAADFGRDIGVQNVILEGDSLIVVKALQTEAENLSLYGHFIDDTRLLLRQFRTAEIQHVKRQANQAAHGLAKEAVKDCIDNIWMEDSPPCISDIIDLERLALVI